MVKFSLDQKIICSSYGQLLLRDLMTCQSLPCNARTSQQGGSLIKLQEPSLASLSVVHPGSEQTATELPSVLPSLPPP